MALVFGILAGTLNNAAMGREVIDGQSTERYRLIGDGEAPLQIDLWYTAAGDWVALESLSPEGRRLRYVRK